MSTVDRIAAGLVAHRRVALLAFLVVFLTVGAGVTQLQQADGLQSFEIGTTEEDKLDYVESNFSTGPANRTVAQVVVRDEDVLDTRTLVATLELQQAIRTNATVAPTLREGRPTVGVANVLARAAIRRARPGVTRPTLDRQIAALEATSERELDRLASRVLADEAGQRTDALAFMSTDYEPGSATADATMLAVFQTAGGVSTTTNAPDDVVAAQRAVQALAVEHHGETAITVGNGIVTAEQRQSRQDTLSLLGPLSLLFVLVTLAVVYRDLLDVLVSLLGIVLVQVWTFGWLGWSAIAFNPVMIAVPVLLVGLSIDYGIHVFMRYRERRARGGTSPAEAMRTALAGVGVALVWVTVTTVVGFLSNLASPVAPIQELGLISAIGIVGALVVFGLVLPPLKTELDALARRVGIDRDHEPFGTGDGPVAGLLATGAIAAKRAPAVVIALALVLTLLTTAGATQVSTSFDPEDNLVEEAPGWTDHLPAGVRPAEYTIREDLRYVNDHFVRQGSQVELLVEGNVTDPALLADLDRAAAVATNASVTVALADGRARTRSPVTVMQRVAARNDRFGRVYRAADADGDGLPDGNLTALYDRLFDVAPEQASSVLHVADGDYVAARMAVSVNAEASGEATVSAMEEVAGVLEGDGRRVTATGRPVVNQLIQDHLLGTLLTSLLVTLVVVLALLSAIYRLVHGSATLGVVTLVPVLLVVSWVVGTMYVLGYPLSVLTTIVASITVGIGIDYSIHLGERFRAELDRAASVESAITRAATGTGSALLGSAVTTAIGFGILAFGFFPVLRQFGTITAIMIGYAFLASVLVLPSLLVVWARTVGAGSWTGGDRAAPTAASADDD